jgi:nitrite reductase/ring-hydroxylating ferredoxin subunit
VSTFHFARSFEKSLMPDTLRHFVAVCALDELRDGQPRAFEIDAAGAPVCVVKHGGEVRAFTDSCPHRGHALSKGKAEAGILRCALHGWEFRIDDGAAVAPPAPFGLEMHEVRVRDGIVEIGAKR